MPSRHRNGFLMLATLEPQRRGSSVMLLAWGRDVTAGGLQLPSATAQAWAPFDVRLHVPDALRGIRVELVHRGTAPTEPIPQAHADCGEHDDRDQNYP